MKKIIKDILFGFLIIVIVTILEFLVTLPFAEPWELNNEGYQTYINRELLLTALPAAVTAFILARLLRTVKISDAVRRGIIWMCFMGAFYAAVGIGNGNFNRIFGSAGIYVLMAGIFSGPFVYSLIKRNKH
jgi:hypothetical protein